MTLPRQPSIQLLNNLKGAHTHFLFYTPLASLLTQLMLAQHTEQNMSHTEKHTKDTIKMGSYEFSNRLCAEDLIRPRSGLAADPLPHSLILQNQVQKTETESSDFLENILPFLPVKSSTFELPYFLD